MRRTSLLIALFSAAALSFAPSLQAQDSSLEGSYQLVAAESDDINRAIEQAVAKMNFVTRPIARGRLRKTNTPYQSIKIAITSSDVSITTDMRDAITTPSNGTPIRWRREDGEVLDVSTEWEDGALEQIFGASDGQRVNHFSLSPTGERLLMRVTVTSPRLSAPLIYTLRYQKVQQ